MLQAVQVMKNKERQIVSDQRRLGWYSDLMQCGFLDWILEQKGDTSEKQTQIMSIVNSIYTNVNILIFTNVPELRYQY